MSASHALATSNIFFSEYSLVPIFHKLKSVHQKVDLPLLCTKCHHNGWWLVVSPWWTMVVAPRWKLYFHGEPIMTHYPISLLAAERHSCQSLYCWYGARVCLFVSLIYLDSRWLFLFGLPVHYRFQLFSKWQNKLYWSDLSSPAICATAASDNAEYFGPPGVKNYTYFSLDEKRPHLNHQSLLTGGWLSRINFWIFLPLRANGWWPTLFNGVQRFQALALQPPCPAGGLSGKVLNAWPTGPEQGRTCTAS